MTKPGLKLSACHSCMGTWSIYITFNAFMHYRTCAHITWLSFLTQFTFTSTFSQHKGVACDRFTVTIFYKSLGVRYNSLTSHSCLRRQRLSFLATLPHVTLSFTWHQVFSSSFSRVFRAYRNTNAIHKTQNCHSIVFSFSPRPREEPLHHTAVLDRHLFSAWHEYAERVNASNYYSSRKALRDSTWTRKPMPHARNL